MMGIIIMTIITMVTIMTIITLITMFHCSIFNARALPGSTQPLVVKFADGGSSRRKTAVSSPDPTWSGQGSTDGSDQALSPESRHSNGSALGLGTSPVVQTFGPYPPRPLPYVMTSGGARL